MDWQFLVGATGPAQFPPEGLPEIALLGRSNVGKSSLLNCLAGAKKVAFTSATPGRTRQINFYCADGKWRFADLPGYGFARVSPEIQASWKNLIEYYLLHRQSLELAILVIDARRGWMDMDLELKDWLEAHGRRYLVVATKMDKLNQSERMRGLAALRKELSGGEPLPFSALTGQGARELWQAITKPQIKP